MGMTIDKCINMLMAKEKCMERKTSGTDINCNYCNCDNCYLCYEQGNMGEQREALKFAVDTMQKMENKTPYIRDLEEENRQLKNRCHALTHGVLCGTCYYDCSSRSAPYNPKEFWERVAGVEDEE